MQIVFFFVAHPGGIKNPIGVETPTGAITRRDNGAKRLIDAPGYVFLRRMLECSLSRPLISSARVGSFFWLTKSRRPNPLALFRKYPGHIYARITARSKAFGTHVRTFSSDLVQGMVLLRTHTRHTPCTHGVPVLPGILFHFIFISFAPRRLQVHMVCKSG